MKKRVLVTGGLGFIGSYFVELLLKKGFYVINVDKVTYAARKDLNFEKYKNYEFIKEDICHLKHLPPNIDYLVNFAAETHVDNSIIANKVFFDTNVYGVYNLLELVRGKDSADRPIFIQISTDEVYGDVLKGSRNEKDLLKPSNPYAATKSAAEQLIFAWGRTYGIKYKICRSSNNYGYGQYPEKLIPKTILYALENKPMTIHGDGSARREWTYVEDNVEGIYLVMEKGEINEIYNISSGEEYSVLEIVKMILKEMKKPEDFYLFVEDRPGQDIRYSLDSSKIRKLGWKPKMTLKKYLPLYIKKFKQEYLKTKNNE
ncbi:MAG: GDP-mannose 4,6-dehydratase [Candidatus Micrarchaeia archaeon]